MRLLRSLYILLMACPLLGQTPTDPTGGIAGIVERSNGEPLGKAIVYALPENEMNRPPLTTLTAPNGHFSFSGLKPGGFYLDASKKDAGYIYSLFSFYIMPGQNKPKVEVAGGKITSGVVVTLGSQAAYLNILVTSKSGPAIQPRLVFDRPDLPGDYKLSLSKGGLIPVPAVPFSISVEAPGYKTWTYVSSRGSKLIMLKPTQVLPLDVVLTPE